MWSLGSLNMAQYGSRSAYTSAVYSDVYSQSQNMSQAEAASRQAGADWDMAHTVTMSYQPPAPTPTPTPTPTPAPTPVVTPVSTPDPVRVQITDPAAGSHPVDTSVIATPAPTVNASASLTAPKVIAYLTDGTPITALGNIPASYSLVGHTSNGTPVYGPPGSPVGTYDFTRGTVTDSYGHLIGLLTSSPYPIIGYASDGTPLTSVPAGYAQIGNAQNGLPIYGPQTSGSGGGPVDASQSDALPTQSTGQTGDNNAMVWLKLGLLAFFALK